MNALLKLAENVAVDDLCIITRDEEEMIVERREDDSGCAGVEVVAG